MKKQKKWFSADELHRKWMKDPEYRREYDKLETEFQIASQVIGARLKRKMSQDQLARKVNTGQAVISRLEGMNGKPSISLLERVAKALDTKINITIQ
ncbi:MAG: helix-turn-helix transcriptional regulator [Patescibacteria group bacterium]